MSTSTALRVVLGPLHPRTWRDGAFLAAGTALALPFLLAPFFVPTLTALQRSRFESLLGVAIPADLRPDRAAWLRRLAYHGLCAPAIALGAVAVLATWPAALLALSAPGWLRYAPGDHSWGAGKGYVIVASASILGVWAAGALAGLLVHADRLAAQTLLGPDRVRALAERVETLAESRAEVVDAADAERRRIERDLHDGAQQRLVSLSMNLGLARRAMRSLSPDEKAAHAEAAMAEAHAEAQAAIAELRDLVRGLHPVVLDDRGLDAALSGVAARAPIPVSLQVELDRRAAPTVEAVAYFVVSEALANIAKHARASRAEVVVRRTGELLRITVTDDGVGGADPAKGTGLAGLRQRAASVDGTLALSSPVGGPTRLTVELPCEL
ncbi:sensor histidine kinase [Streptacidiphilus monticola]|uniref:histidine kinase n=1 Tax=Streptacidiphilus monticola TaxID=2161674 RepID=A0ABW1G7G9_9ACTN